VVYACHFLYLLGTLVIYFTLDGTFLCVVFLIHMNADKLCYIQFEVYTALLYMLAQEGCDSNSFINIKPQTQIKLIKLHL
jgi:hypothetical protein